MTLLAREELPVPPGYTGRAAFHRALAAEIDDRDIGAFTRQTQGNRFTDSFGAAGAGDNRRTAAKPGAGRFRFCHWPRPPLPGMKILRRGLARRRMA